MMLKMGHLAAYDPGIAHFDLPQFPRFDGTPRLGLGGEMRGSMPVAQPLQLRAHDQKALDGIAENPDDIAHEDQIFSARRRQSASPYHKPQRSPVLALPASAAVSRTPFVFC